MKLYHIIVSAAFLLQPFFASADTVPLRGAVQAASDEAAAIDLGNRRRGGSSGFCGSVCSGSGCFDDCRDNLRDFCEVS